MARAGDAQSAVGDCPSRARIRPAIMTCPRWRYQFEIRKVQVASLNDCQLRAVV